MDITKEQLLVAKGDELSRLLGEVLGGGQTDKRVKGKTISCPHCLGNNSFKIKGDNSWEVVCPWVGCLKPFTITRSLFVRASKSKTIPLDDWNVSMQWRDWAVTEFGLSRYKSTLFEIYTGERTGGHSFGRWMMYIKPKHYLKAAAICKIGESK